MLPDNQSFILWWGSSENFHLFMEKSLRIFLDEVIIDCIEMIGFILVTKIFYHFFMFFYRSTFISNEVQHLDWVVSFIVFFTFDNCDSGLLRYHPDHHSGLDSKENIISSDNLCINIAIGKRTNGRLCIILQLIYKGYYSQNSCPL